MLPLVVGKAQLGLFYADRIFTAPEGVPPAGAGSAPVWAQAAAVERAQRVASSAWRRRGAVEVAIAGL